MPSTLNIALTSKMHFTHHGTITVEGTASGISLVLDFPKKKLLSSLYSSKTDVKPGQAGAPTLLPLSVF